MLVAIVVLAVSSALGNVLKCPNNLEPNDLWPNSNNSNKYYKCLPSGLLQPLTCPTGQYFDKAKLECFKPAKILEGYGEMESPQPTVLSTQLPVNNLFKSSSIS